MALPVDRPGDVPIGGGGRPAGKCRGRHVDGQHLPPLLGQPHGVAALAAPKVQGAARDHAAELLDQALVGLSAPHAVVL
ncbi:MAG TPA: hypothetical protein VMM13_14670, partial [Euzebya sp.]|nr:hypothetical protein [Euzebya sp.]